VIDSIEEFLQIEIDHPAVTVRKVQLCLGYCLMCGSSWSKTVAVIGKRSVPPPLQNLHHRLLEKSIERSWDTKFSHPPSVRFLDFHAPYRLRFIGPVQQLFPDGEPALLQVATELADGHPVDPCATLVALHPS
jgi:hypothetical protein